MFKSKKIKITTSLILIIILLLIGHNTSYKRESGTKQVSAGYGFSLLLKGDNILWGCGLNTYGQLGIKKNNRNEDDGISYTKIMTDVKKVAAGYTHTLVIKNDGSLWGFGSNYCGELGTDINTGTSNPNPKPIKVMDNVKDVAAGYHYSLVIKTDGSLWSFGANAYGQLGINVKVGFSDMDKFAIITKPVKIMSNVKTVTTGNMNENWTSHTLVLKNDNTLWGFGCNQDVQLCQKQSETNPTPVKLLDNVISMAAGNDYSLALKTDHTLWGCGSKTFRQLGRLDEMEEPKDSFVPHFVQIMTNVKSVYASENHSFAIKTDNSLWGFGVISRNVFGMNIRVPKGNNTAPVKIMDNVETISTGSIHTLIIKKDKSLWAVGVDASCTSGKKDSGILNEMFSKPFGREPEQVKLPMTYAFIPF